ncbi:hypothetical protein IW261DRAFT_1571572 [Armillaria novae-zelandiae]|uniref:DUF6534 domain-containing protein n=1 Tax=Armillaria novae-zelandiae TaxID=153914 RepID=A0AA39NU35_9AGAR|nr:hypothetical protein IW261DRAFT_1571572 [Armillaria novae-zelandiae]
MNSQPLITIPSTGETFGVLYVGATIAAMLFGITNLQTVIYYKRYPNDWWLSRYSVALLWVLDTLHVVFSTHALYFYLIDMFGDLSGALVHSVCVCGSNNKLAKMPSYIQAQSGINVVIVIYVLGLYAIQLWKRRHFHKVLSWFVFFTTAASLGAGIFMIYDISTTPDFSAISNIEVCHFRDQGYLRRSPDHADIRASLMMCYYLHNIRAALISSTTACYVLNLMRLVIVSGLATSTCSLLTLISYVAWPESLIFLGIVFILPKLYVNSLLAMFNHRPQHQLKKQNLGHNGNLTSAILRFASDTTTGTEVSAPPSEIQGTGSFSDESDRSEGRRYFEV